MTWRDRLIALLREQANPPHKYSHQPRLYALTQQIVAAEPIAVDDDVVFAAAFLHDLGVFVGHRPEDPEQLRRWDHVAYITERAPGLLANAGFPRAKVPAVLDAIRQHQPQDEPHSPEATVLRDADILEQLGAVGILRTAAKLGSDTRFHSFADAQRSLARALETLPPQIRLRATRELAAPRVELLRDFLQALAAEAGEHLD